MEEGKNYIHINSESIKNINLPLEINDIYEWFKIIYTISKEDNLSVALKFCRMRDLSDEQNRAVVIMSELIRQEASGNLIPPINLFEAYRNIAEQENLK